MSRIDRLTAATGFMARNIDRGGHVRLVERAIADPAVLTEQMRIAQVRLLEAERRRRERANRKTTAAARLDLDGQGAGGG